MKRDAAVLVSATVLFRALVLWLLPESAQSGDLRAWAQVADLLQAGRNPYIETLHLSWPPLWMQVIYVLSEIARVTGLSVIDLARWMLIGVESVNVVFLLIIAARYLQIENARKLLLIGIALNPISALLVCQHANFDALVVTTILWFALSLLRYRDSGNEIDWLMACFALGIGILVKTIPFVLVPLLAWRVGSIPNRVRGFGAALLVAPAAIGMSVIYVLAPAEVTQHVLLYRSYGEYFGITGLLGLAHLPAVSNWYTRLFPLIVLVFLLVAALRFSKVTEASSRQIVLAIAVILVVLIAFGPGYGPQYLAWPLPFVVLSYPLFDRQWSRDVLTLYVVTAVIFVVEYALILTHGWFLVAATGSRSLRELSDILSEPGLVTLIRLPLFAGCLWFLASAVRRLRPGLSSSRAGV